MNIIILGCGKVGMKLVERFSLEEGHNITVVDQRYSAIENVLNDYDVMGVVGNGLSAETLNDAGIEKADMLIAVTGSDEMNLLACLMAKKYGKSCKSIPRVRKPEYSKSFMMFKDDLSLAMVLNPEYAAASEIARLLRFPSAIQIDTFAKGRVEILKFEIEEDSVLNNIKIMDIVAKLGCDILVCGVERDGSAYIPGGDFVLKKGDFISIIASIQSAAQFFKKIGIKTDRVKDTMIVGGGDIAFYLATMLIQHGIGVKIIEQNPQRCEELCQLLPKATIINGDGTDKRLLLEEGLEYAESFVSLTNIDEENVLLSLYAKSISKAKIVTKINRIAYDEVIDNLNLDAVIYPKNISADYILRFMRAKKNSIGSNIETLHLILDGKAEALEFRIKNDCPVANIRIDHLKLKKNLLIACITRNGKVMIPRGRDTILPGDAVIVVTLKSGFKDIEDILE